MEHGEHVDSRSGANVLNPGMERVNVLMLGVEKVYVSIPGEEWSECVNSRIRANGSIPGVGGVNMPIPGVDRVNVSIPGVEQVNMSILRVEQSERGNSGSGAERMCRFPSGVERTC
ncbi:hypothetical protein chiPu_0002257 [Chiloscyllium punctatum]|uniref:Uncharacterized protein n=1 Tax=Chiloscyllium punctatum TaxID=137246 RepID=A0A401S0E7_CHIPU|nr:hypothetical protein [Chiloscyllium punctatum]